MEFYSRKPINKGCAELRKIYKKRQWDSDANMKTKKGDFVRLDYVGRVKITGMIFDLTQESVAKKEGIFREEQKYIPSEVMLGAGHLLKGLEEELIGQEIGKELKVDIKPKDGFGERNLSLIKVLPKGRFKEKFIMPGMEVQVGNMRGTVSSVSGGRVRVDFNHPLAGKDLEYKVKIISKVSSKKDQLAALIRLHKGTDEGFKIKVSGNKGEVEFKASSPYWPLIQKKIEEEAKKHLGLKVKFKALEGKETKTKPKKK